MAHNRPSHTSISLLLMPELFIVWIGFTGIQCEININECEPNPCLNGGTCQDLINGFMCSCANGFSGSRCQINIDDCMSQPCRNKGICHDSIASYTCECPPGYTGNFVEEKNQFFSHFPRHDNFVIKPKLTTHNRFILWNKYKRLPIVAVLSRHLHRWWQFVYVPMQSRLHGPSLPNANQRMRIESLSVRWPLRRSHRWLSVQLFAGHVGRKLRSQCERVSQ